MKKHYNIQMRFISPLEIINKQREQNEIMAYF